ncbi:rho GTPase-activating protein 44-like isoform X2 [Ornithodoros turicata]|uniref:rho GTPase-activating protein 44-like isoform X2 n=1 Tax=Ornithodoros turicata TaxID=34597 RepID=UPI003138650F
MKKQILRVKQLADQTLLRADKSEVLTEDLVVAEKRVDAIKQTCTCAQKRISSCLHNVSLEDASNEKLQKKVPELAMFHSLQECHKILGNSNLLGCTLSECANLQGKLGQELLNYEKETDRQILQPITQLLENELPNISKLRRQLSKLTLDMDSAKNRYQQALKHMQQAGNASGSSGGAKTDNLKEEAEDTTAKVEQCRDALASEMLTLISREPEFAHLLCQWYQLQADYHRRALAELDATLPAIWKLIGDSPQKPVFGYPLEEHLRVTDRKIALVIEKCACCLLTYGMDEEGLFRITGSASKIKKLKSAFNAGVVDMTESERDPHTVASTLKLYLRELPEPLMTFSLYEEWMKATSVADPNARLQALWQVVKSLPEPNHDNLRYVVKFLAKLATNSERNKMTSQNIAIVIAPNLVWAREENQSLLMGVNMGIANIHSSIVDTLVNYADWFFPGDEEFVSSPPSSARGFGDPGASSSDHSFETTNGDMDDSFTGSSSPPGQSPRAFHRSGKKPAPPAPAGGGGGGQPLMQPRDRSSFVLTSHMEAKLPPVSPAPRQNTGGTLERRRPVPLARQVSKPEVAEKPTQLLHRRSQENITETCNTHSLERRPLRPPPPKTAKPTGHVVERPSVPPPERPKSDPHKPTPEPRPRSETLTSSVVETSPVGKLQASLKKDEGSSPLSSTELLSFADDSDTEEELPRSRTSLTNGDPDEERNECAADNLVDIVGAHLAEQDDVVLRRSLREKARWDFLTASDSEHPPERPPRTSPSEGLEQHGGDEEAEEARRETPSPNINTSGPPPDLIASSEAKAVAHVDEVIESEEQKKVVVVSGVALGEARSSVAAEETRL